MYRKSNQSSISPEKFELPVAISPSARHCVIELSSENRWVIMAELIPWSDFEVRNALRRKHLNSIQVNGEEEYAQNFSEDRGAPAKP
jgi:hypothetical protein